MTDRKMLLNLICESMDDSLCIAHCNHFPCHKVEIIADYLIANGVTVRKMQKPLAYSKVFHSQCLEPQWWVELENGDIFCSRDEEGMFSLDSYGKTWRCWKEKPTEEERKAAEWL